VASLLDDVALRHHHDAIRLARRGEAVSDDDRGATTPTPDRIPQIGPAHFLAGDVSDFYRELMAR
jgi:hypothetical protein